VPGLREHEASRNTLDVEFDQQLLSESASGNPLPDIPLFDAPLPSAPPDSAVGKERTGLRVAEEAMIVVLGLRSGSCLVCFLSSNLFISGIEYYTHRKVFASLRVIFFIVLWNIEHAAFLQLLAYK
jgi:hypothetical protein